MEKFGGGGHLNNAAAQVRDMTIPEVAEKIEEYIKETFKEETTMRVILIKDIRGKGKKGDVIDDLDTPEISKFDIYGNEDDVFGDSEPINDDKLI